MKISNSQNGGAFYDTYDRDTLRGNDGDDIFTLHRDGQKDILRRFDIENDLIDISAYNVTWHEVNIKHFADDRYEFVIRGETTLVTLTPAQNGEIRDFRTLTEDHFIYNSGAAIPASNILLDDSSKNKIFGTDQSDIFIFHEDEFNDVVKEFDPLKDKIDLSGYNVTFSELTFETSKAGKVLVRFLDDSIVVRDCSYEMVGTDYTEEMFIF